MVFRETKLAGAYVIEMEKLEDSRGFFARSWCKKEFAEHGLAANTVQCNVSFNLKKGTLRGMHYQLPPWDEAKVVRCIRGAIYDVIIDLRAGSPTYRQHIAEALTAGDYKMLYVPAMFAHGFQTLEDNTEVFYQMSAFYAPEYGRGVRWNDSAFGICWPISEVTIHDRDRNYPDFQG